MMENKVIVHITLENSFNFADVVWIDYSSLLSYTWPNIPSNAYNNLSHAYSNLSHKYIFLLQELSEDITNFCLTL